MTTMTSPSQESYLAVKGARYADNFLVAAHPNQNIVTQYEFRENDAQDVVLMYQENTGLWAELPDDSQQGDFRTSILTILPSVDIDCDSDNTTTTSRCPPGTASNARRRTWCEDRTIGVERRHWQRTPDRPPAWLRTRFSMLDRPPAFSRPAAR
jgi:hypothetical protein